MEDFIGLIILVIGVAIGLYLVFSIVHIVREYERLVVFFFGRLQGARGPGIVLLIPFVQQSVKVDLRERFLEVPQQTCITKDNAPISIDFLVYSKVFQPDVTVTAVTDFTGASQALAATTLRAVIGDIPLDDVLAKREEINHTLRAKLDEVTERWGVKITSVEIREIVPPRDIQEAMNRQMSAERNRRANITESEGTRQATINVAEGDKQSNILRAEGDRQSQILRAEGYANALHTIFGAASGIDEKTMALQYLEALKTLAAGESTKWIVPMELSELTRPITAAMRRDAAVGQHAGRRAEDTAGGMIRGLFRTVGTAIGLVTGAYLAMVAVRGSRALVRPVVRPFLPDAPDAPATPADIGLEYESVRFTTDDGVTLSGWLIPAARETRTAVIVLHGFSGHRLPELAAFVPWLHERHHVLQFDFRGHGQSEGNLVTLGSHERRDVAAAVRFAESRGLGPTALFGISMGAAIAIVSAPDLPVAAVVADASFADIRHPVTSRLREGRYPLPRIGARMVVGGAMLRARARLMDPIRAVAGIAPRALLLIAPREDQLISWRQSLRLYEAAGEPKELMVVEGAGSRGGLLRWIRRHIGRACSISWSAIWSRPPVLLTRADTHRFAE